MSKNSDTLPNAEVAGSPRSAPGTEPGSAFGSRVRPIRSWLFAPGNNAKLLDRVFATETDAVVLDLEDAVPPDNKPAARELVAAAVAGQNGRTGPAVFVRINAPGSGFLELDLAAAVRPGLDGLRVPKLEDAASVRHVADLVARAERAAGLAPGTVGIAAGIESSLGAEQARDIASASPRVAVLTFGAVDFVRDIGARPSATGLETLYARSRLVMASRLAGIRPPVEGVFGRLDDEAGLVESTTHSRDLGFFGRTCVHPRQVPIVNAIYTPDERELEWAQEVIEATERSQADGTGAVRLPNGDFVDVAVTRRAADIVRLRELLRLDNPTPRHGHPGRR